MYIHKKKKHLLKLLMCGFDSSKEPHAKVAPDLLIKAFPTVWMPEDAKSFDSSVTLNPTCAYSITVWALLSPSHRLRFLFDSSSLHC